MSKGPDEVNAKDQGGGFEPHPVGQFAMRCVDVVNLGTNVETYAGQDPREVEKVAIVFASGERQDGKGLTIVTAEMTNSMNEKANLRKFLEDWRGKSYTQEQAEAGVPLHKLYGQSALVSIEHITTRRGRKFAKIRSISPLPKQMPGPGEDVLREYARPQFLDDKKKQYAEALAKHRNASDEPPPGEYPSDLDDGDIPF